MTRLIWEPTGIRRRKPWKLQRICPRCKENPLPIGRLGAISRQDNHTEICSRCGAEEMALGLTRPDHTPYPSEELRESFIHGA